MLFQKSRSDDILMFGCFGDIDNQGVEELGQELVVEDNFSKIVLDLGSTYKIDPMAIRSLSLLVTETRKKGVGFYLLHASKTVQREVIELGLDRLLYLIDEIDEIKVKVRKKRSVDAGFLNAFIEGAMTTLSIQCSFECVAGKAESKSEDFNHSVDIAGVIGITSEGFTGSISICFPEKVFLAIMSNMLGEDCSEINQEMEDGAGELLNIIFGYAKKTLNENGYQLEKAIPTIVRGNQLKLKHGPAYCAFILPFESQAGSFYMEIGTEL